MGRRGRRRAGIRNEFSGEASSVMQVGSVHGDFTVHAPASLEPLARAAESLAVAVREQWRREAEVRSLHRPRPLRLRWSDEYATEPAQGGMDDVVAKFRTLPHPQLVVLGKPGSGKTVTALLFTLGMLAARKRGDPVPVMLTVSSWDPRAEHLHAWIARRLEEDYKALANRWVYGREAAIRLVRDGAVLPVLDGLDELPADLHAKAIDRIDHATGSGLPLVVTCRSEEYETAVAAGGTTLSAAAVVELHDVGIEDTIEFLSAGVPSVSRWTPVFDHLRQHPAGPLATALSTPLMVHLARIAYRNPSTDPAELLDVSRFDHVDVIEHHLLDVFVPAKYDQDPAVPLTAKSAPALRSYPPHQAEKWLTFLASDLRRRRVREFAWWELPARRALPVVAVIAVLPITFFPNPALTLAVNGLVLGVSVEWLGNLLATKPSWHPSLWTYLRDPFRTAASREPRQVSLRMKGRLRNIAVRASYGFLTGSVLGVGGSMLSEQSRMWALALWFGLAAGAMSGLGAWLAVPSHQFNLPDPVVALRHDRRSASLLVLIAIISVIGPLALVDVPVGNDRVAGRPEQTLGLLAFGAAFGLGFVWTSAWIASLLARAWWALRGKLPWRLMTFLDDAHRRGVLRKAGMVYQFQHALLQNRLAGATEADTLGSQTLTAGHGLPGRYVFDLFMDTAGRMWVGMLDGVAVCENDEWRVFDRSDGLLGSTVSCIRQDARGQIWVATPGGLCRWHNGRFVAAGCRGEDVTNIHFDRDQRLWAGCWRDDTLQATGGLQMFDGVRWHAMSTQEGAPGQNVVKVFEDSAGRIWVSSCDFDGDLGVSCWDGSSWRRFTRAEGLVDDRVDSMVEDPGGRMWFGTGKGISIYDGTTWQSVTTADGLIDNRVRAMFVDTGKTMWIGTEGGVSRFDGTQWRSFVREDGLADNQTRAIAQDRHGRLWFGSDRGITRTRRLGQPRMQQWPPQRPQGD